MRCSSATPTPFPYVLHCDELCCAPLCPPVPPCCCRYLDNMTSERVDAEGVANVAAAAAAHMQRDAPSVQDVLSMRTAEDLAKWQR